MHQFEIQPLKSSVTLIWSINVIQYHRIAIYDILYTYFILTVITRCIIYEMQTLKVLWLIWDVNVIKGRDHEVDWKIIYDFAYVLYI